jgi:hypothetical protein
VLLRLLVSPGMSGLVWAMALPPRPDTVHGGRESRLRWDELPPVVPFDVLPRYNLDMVSVFLMRCCDGSMDVVDCCGVDMHNLISHKTIEVRH